MHQITFLPFLLVINSLKDDYLDTHKFIEVINDLNHSTNSCKVPIEVQGGALKRECMETKTIEFDK